jgi:hypothetical protein
MVAVVKRTGMLGGTRVEGEKIGLNDRRMGTDGVCGNETNSFCRCRRLLAGCRVACTGLSLSSLSV